MKICACGKEFKLARWEAERKYPKRYCSRSCMYKYREKKVNSGCFKAGGRPSPETEFKKGLIPHNFKGDRVGYHALHEWISRHNGKAAQFKCGCGKQADGWANLSGEYKRDLDDFEAMCFKCHRIYDRDNIWGAIKEHFVIRNGRNIGERL